ncbi:peroxiredoxin [Tundrisphaera lichenicola]|uniref:peroxiredoxin n=1 Tax=Tundrisphaera lichenicola TaxID=2029860 RepID=UPI003EBB2459
MSIKTWGLAALIGLGIVLDGGTVRAAEELKVGDKAPDFSLKASDGKTYSLSDYKGKQPIVIAWFPKAFTGGCTMECKSFRANSEALKSSKVAYFTASVDTPEQNAKFAESLDLDYPILSDPSKTTAEAFGVLAKSGFASRWTFYIDKDGVIKEIDKKINNPQAGEDVAAKIKSLGLGE